MKEIKIIETKSELGAGTRGASLGIDALKIAGLNQRSTLFKELPSVEIEHMNHLLYEETDTPNARYIEGIFYTFQRVCAQVARELKETHFPIILTGDHSSSGATIAGIKTAYPHKRLGVVWIDAHADMHSPYTSPSGNVHGMPLAIALGEDNLEKKRNDISEHTKYYWDKVKNLFTPTPWLKPHDLVFAGVRDVEAEEIFLIDKHQVPNYTVEVVQQRGGKAIAQDILQYLDHCDQIYISFDVDSLDCELISTGTGTPVPHGFTDQEAEDLILGLLESPKVVCLEIVEINPTLDNKRNNMADTAFSILEKAARKIQKKQLTNSKLSAGPNL